MRRAYSYSRVSSGPQASRGKGLGRQLDLARQWAQSHGAELDESLTLADRGKSASKGEHLLHGAALAQFLAAALAGELGTDPILLVEDITRLSRQEPLDALEQVLQPLIRAGVEIVTLEDGASYTRERLNGDPSSLIVLIVKIQAAADYSRKLSRYSLHRRAQNRADILQGLPVCTGWTPSWIRWNGSDWEFTPYVTTVRRVIELLWQDGCGITCQIVNREGLLSPSGRRWTQAQVLTLAHSPALYGARRVAAPGYGETVRQWRAAGGGPGKPKPQYQVVPGTWPAIMTEEEWRALGALIQRRRTSPLEHGRRDRMLFVGALLSSCTCGGPIGVRTAHGARHVYLLCRAKERGQCDCQARPMRMEAVQAALLVRLQGDELAKVLQTNDGRAAAVRRQLAEAQGALAVAEEREANARAALRERAMSGRGMLDVYEEALAAAGVDVAHKREQLAQRTAEAQAMDCGIDAPHVAERAADLLRAFARGEDTIEQRKGVHRLLRDLGIRLIVDLNAHRLAICRGDVTTWEPLDQLQSEMLARGRSGVTTRAEAGGVVALNTEEVLYASPNEQE